MDPGATAYLITQGALGIGCLALGTALIVVYRELRACEKNHVTVITDMAKVVGTVEQTIAALKEAVDAKTRSELDGAHFRQEVTKALDSLEKMIERTLDRLERRKEP